MIILTKWPPLHSQPSLSDNSHVLKSGPLLRNAGLTEKRNVLMWAEALPVAALLLAHLWSLFHDHSDKVASLHSQPLPHNGHVLKSGPPSEMQA